MSTTTLLAVDDEASNLRLFERLVAAHLPECDLITALSAEEGLAILAERPVAGALVDIQMSSGARPCMDGIEMCRQLKADPTTTDIHVILVTSHEAQSDLKAQGLEAGADDFINRPIDNVELIARIKVMLRLRQREDELRNINARLEELVEERTAEIEAAMAELDQILNTAADAMILVDRDFNVVRVNDTFCALYGLRTDEAAGRKCYEILGLPGCHTDDCPMVRILSGASSVERDVIVETSGGSQVPCILTAKPFCDSHGEMIGIVKALRDISDRKQAEEALRRSEERYRSLTDDVLNTSAVGTFILDSDFEVVWINQALERYFGIPRDQVIGKDKRQLIRECIKDIFEAPQGFAEKVLSTYENNTYVENFECHVLPDGEREERWLEHWSQPISSGLYADGRIEHYTDITDRKRTEEALRERTHQLGERVKELNCVYGVCRLIQTPGISLQDVLRGAAELIPSACQYPEITSARITVERQAFEAGAGGEAVVARLAANIIVLGKPVGAIEVRYHEKRPENDEGPFLAEERSLLDAIARRLGEAIERKRAEQALYDSEERFRAVFETAQASIFIKDCDLRYTHVNPEMEKLFGLSASELIAKTDEELFGQEAGQHVREVDSRVVAGESVAEEDTKPVAGVPHTFYVTKQPIRDSSGEITGLCGIAHDITEHKELEEQLRQSQKMEAVGQLAGGLAHDFNNMLTAVTVNAGLLLRKIDDSSPLHRHASEIRTAANQAGSLTHQLLAFSHRQVLQPQVLDLNDVVTDIQPMLRRLVEEDIELVTHLDPELEHIEADPGQIEQVIMNLAVNARDAMPDGGKLTIETLNVHLDENHVRHHPDNEVGPHVMLVVNDTGVGMTQETLSRVFDPFFTTKEEGTGLGLSTVYGIVKQSGGSIHAYSEPGQGTTFKVYLPRVDKEVAAMMHKSTGASDELEGGETILVVEDEELVRGGLVTILNEFGYSVLAAADGTKALRICEQHEGQVDLLVTDVIMPEMSGPKVAARVTRLKPGVKVLYLSGYADNVIGYHGVLEPGTHFLEKPFEPKDLTCKIRQILDAPEPDQG